MHSATRIGFSLLLATLGCLSVPYATIAQDADVTESDPKKAAEMEQKLVSNPRQLTFEGRRAGEGYFSQDGSLLVFQSEREASNPFFQIYLMDLETGDLEQVSPGQGKTTCAWIHPDNQRVLYASTQDDPDALKEQQEEIDLRESGQERRYSWDYDPYYDIYAYDRKQETYTNLTKAEGYDAEGSYSPDGKLIAFASNRLAYSRMDLTDREKEMFEIDPAYMMDIFIMNADGSDVKQLTDVPGYDGGPFFSPDGSRICWRRFAENGATAEIYSMNIDGSDVRQLTKLSAMSWAPYFHPSGEYLIFATNRHGFANFELYVVDAKGRGEPQRVTYTAGFDGLPVFSPDGKKLSWTSNRTSSGQSQLFLADWNHEAAQKLLQLDELADADPTEEATKAAKTASLAAEKSIVDADLVRHVDYLCHPELGGRMTGTRGEKLATAYVAAYFEHLGLTPAGDDGWFQEFSFTAGISLGESNSLTQGDKELQLDRDWRPLSFSKSGKIDPANVVFAGYGITAPATNDFEEYDSYVHLDVKDKWVLAFRFMPEGISPELRQHFNYHSSLRYKAMQARDRGARGIIFVSGPNSNVRSQLIPLSMDGSVAGTSIPVITIADDVADAWLQTAGKSLGDLQTKLDTGDISMGFELEQVKLAAEIELNQVRSDGRNVIGRLQVGEKPSDEAILVGAHIDHLGSGNSSSSLARDDERGNVHFGADDNASGVAAMLEIAEYLANLKASGKLDAKRDIIFAAWSGEELGTLGSSHYVKTLAEKLNQHGGHHGAHGEAAHAEAAHAEAAHGETAHGEAEEHGEGNHGDASHGAVEQADPNSIYPYIAACLNMDMIGRFREKLVLQGIGSSPAWKAEIEQRNAPIGLPITLQDDCYLPTDATEFFLRGVPILAAFTGQHEDYHTPRDTPDKLNYQDTARIARLMGLIARSLAMKEDAPEYTAQEAKQNEQRRANLRAWLGTVPEYGADEVVGVPISGATKDSPADKAGLKAGDVIIELAGKKIENIYDYTYAIEALNIGQTVKMVVRRGDKEIEMEITPGSRD